MDKEIARPKWMTPFLVVLLCILLFVAAGGTSAYYLNKAHDDEKTALEDQIDKMEGQVKELRKAKEIPTVITEATKAISSTAPVVDPTADWKSYAGITQKYSIKYPTNWTISKAGSDSLEAGETESLLFKFAGEQKDDNDASLNIYDMSVWPTIEIDPSEGYVVPKADRMAISQIFTKIYAQKNLLEADKTEIKKYGLGFMGYARGDQRGIKYIENTKGDWRGVSFYTARGQDVGVGAVYHAVLYSQTQNKLINFFTNMTGQAFKVITDKNTAIFAETDSVKMVALDATAHQWFTNTVESSTKPVWSAEIDKYNLVAQSIVY